ncbi:MAG: elongation factor P [Chloroflexota bacterium]|nr:elongation factor P [Chloroflexota bacterium]
MSIGYGDLRKGMAIELDGQPYIVAEYERSKMQKRAPVMRVKFRELKTGRLVERTFQGFDVKLTPASVERRKAQYIYSEDDLYYFMDSETFDQSPLTKDQLGESLQFLVEQINVDLILSEGNPVTIELPTSIDIKVTDAPPGHKGDTAQGGSKPATLETGLVVQVPLFINSGETVKIDTRTGEYLSRS